MSHLCVDEREELERDLELLIREARRRQRRRRLRWVVATAVVIGAGVVAAGQIHGWFASPAGTRSGPSAEPTAVAARCPVSPVRWVANSQFDAYVLGNGPLRVGLGVRFGLRRHVVLLRANAGRWAGIEAIWWFVHPARMHGPVTVRGVALGSRAPIEVKPSDGGLAPGSGPLTLTDDYRPVSDSSPFTTFYPGSIWVGGTGCYGLDVEAHGWHERLVFDVAEQR